MKNRCRKEWLLYSGIKALLKCDEAEVVHGIAHYVMTQHWILRVGSAFMERNRRNSFPARGAFLGAIIRFLEIKPRIKDGSALIVARQENEKRELERLPSLVPDMTWSRILFTWRLDQAGTKALCGRPLSDRRRLIRLGRHLLRRPIKYFRILRVIEMIGYYARYLDALQTADIKIAVMSSHSNPHGIAFNIAARKHDVPVALITHGMPVRPVAKLDYDLAVVHCEAAREIYAAAGCRLGKVFTRGRRQVYRPMPRTLPGDNLAVGIFLCKDVNESVFQTLVESLLSDKRVITLIVRPHPKNLWRGLDRWIASMRNKSIKLSSGGGSFKDIEWSDIVLGGNSSVLVDAVTAGRPSCYVKGLDFGSDDLHDFVKRRLVVSFDPTTTLDLHGILRFYQRPDWIDTLRLFANIDEDASAVDEQVADAIRQLAG